MRFPADTPTLHSPDEDPHLWLEQIDDPATAAWADAQTARTLAAFGDAAFERDRDALAAIYDRDDNIPMVTRRGGLLFNFWKDAAHPRGLWRTTTLERLVAGAPRWEVLLDLDALAIAESEDWVWAGAGTLPRTHDRAMLRLSRGGGDAVVLREFDIPARAFVSGDQAFALPASKSAIDWLDRDTLLLSSPLGDGHATRSGYARTVRLWRRGTDPAQAPVLFETAAAHMAAGAQAGRTGARERVWFVAREDFQNVVIWMGDRRGPRTRIEVPTDALVEIYEDWLVLRLRSDWTVDGACWRGGCVLGIGLDAFLGGSRALTPLFEPAARRAVQGFYWTGGQLLLSILDNLRPVFERWTPAPGSWDRTSVAGLPDSGTAYLWPLDACEEESNGDALAMCQGPLTPESLYLLPAGAASPQLLQRAPERFDTRGLVVTRHEAISSDGVAIPYVQTGPAGAAGDAPVHLYGYGGFGISMLPGYNASIGKLWLERGGVSVVAQIRGGGEFGPAWEEAGRRAGKRQSHDDFAAVAADLVRRGVTVPKRIAAEGGSNGGLLVTNMLTRYPDRFGALFCTIPLVDMRRYTKLLAGPSWVAEYGDPDIADDWAFLQHLSAYHCAEPGRSYPPILLASNRRDDRVHPAHARKMTAKLQAIGQPAWLYELDAGGHAYGKNNAERAAFTALGYGFLRRSIGWA
ncbi:prolyl oligopeptidase family serine peptidase [Variovorax sp. J22G21]|uniref:prolyl oligopeptidase family serine peptidase n=1 Tax=Variovorax fucosicus TaxID=3053517 RepID=UPI0025768540|nr:MULTISPECIES: prolyl oligopeptidase family serine peptidase [unclassified Variovorax]MDM0039848.1 prolyl oligopeptidase family serine peptidase [Variovorax sp. J22R193]MDM0064603.1 prolyl oligopeptidase family serine peptidase [Variovorax sp. J22G21]